MKDLDELRKKQNRPENTIFLTEEKKRNFEKNASDFSKSIKDDDEQCSFR